MEQRRFEANLEAEEAILGGLLMDGAAISRVVDNLSPEMFYVVAHQEIYRSCLALYLAGQPIDLISVSTELHERGILEKCGGRGKIIDLCDKALTAVNIDYYAELVRDKYLRRQLAEAGQRAIRLSHSLDLPLIQVLDGAEQAIFRVTQLSLSSSQGLTPVQRVLTKTIFELEKRCSSEFAGLATGFYDLDAMTNGLQRSDLIIIAGRPSMGKTALGLELAKNIATIHRLPVAIFSLEMSQEQLVYRLLASQSKMRPTDAGIDSSRLRSGHLSEQEWQTLSLAIQQLSELPIYIDDTPAVSLAQIRSQLRRLQSQTNSQLGMVLIDYLQLLEINGADNRVQELSRITRSLKSLARELAVPVVALSQLSRAVETRANKRPLLADLRESGSIEQDADLVINLYRDEYYNPDTTNKGIIELIIAKHRNGPTGTVKLLFDPKLTKFTSIEP